MNLDHPKFQEGIAHFNRGKYFEAHESWEEIWLASTEPEKTFLQGIIQVAAAFHHYVRRNRRGAKSLLRAGLAKLEGFPARHRGIALESLRASLRHWLDSLEAGETSPPNHIPRIKRARAARR
jgi:predicted metal-dependent hydrolase